MFACIDLGTNSFHLLIAKARGGSIEIVERLSEKVQLGENLAFTGNISQQSHQRGLACLKRFEFLMRQYPLQKYWALGTNTFRIANNAHQFIQSARAIGIDIAIISGVQEAALIYVGVTAGMQDSIGRKLVIDIGGGSTEIIVGKGLDRVLTESLPIGSVSWRDSFFSEVKYNKSQIVFQMSEGSEKAFDVFNGIAKGVSRASWEEAYASSGTVKMLANICEEYGCKEKQVELDVLLRLKEEIAGVIVTGKNFPGLKERRRDLLLSGWCIMVGLMKAYGIQKINFSPTALREGMLGFMIKNEEDLRVMQSSDFPEVCYAK